MISRARYLGAVAAPIFVSMFAGLFAHAATFTVGTICTLAQAVACVNQGSGTSPCSNPGGLGGSCGFSGTWGNDQINVASNISVTSQLNVLRTVTIEGSSSVPVITFSGSSGSALFNLAASAQARDVILTADQLELTQASGATVTAIKAAGAAANNSWMIEVNVTNSQIIGFSRGAINAPLADVTLTNDYFYQNSNTSNGGAVFVSAYSGTDNSPNQYQHGSLAISNTTFDSNSSSMNGGAIYSAAAIEMDAQPTVSATTLISNSATGSGGGVYLGSPNSGSIYLDMGQADIEFNTAAHGGGVFTIGSATLNFNFQSYTNFIGNNTCGGNACDINWSPFVCGSGAPNCGM